MSEGCSEDGDSTLGTSSEGNGKRKAPRWTIAFLRALERTGEVQAAAEDAGIDKSTAYVRRKAHADFAAEWEGAVCRYNVAKEAKEAEEIAAIRNGSSKVTPPLPPPHRGEGTTKEGRGGLLATTAMSNGQVKRVSKERWGERKEGIFFDELAATANVRRAAEAAGVSTQAVFARRLRDRLFAAKWDAVVRSARAIIDMHLVGEAQKSFDPETIDLSDAAPRVTIDQAIKISQIGASKARAEGEVDHFGGRTATEDVDEIRHRLVMKLQALRRRERPKLIAQGWSYDEEYDREIPPGWVKVSPPEAAGP